MPTCDTCGNSYDKTFEVVTDDQHYTFDSFECAVHKLAPACGHCRCRIMGHGVEAQGIMYCCANCARAAGTTLLRDRAG